MSSEAEPAADAPTSGAERLPLSRPAGGTGIPRSAPAPAVLVVPALLVALVAGCDAALPGLKGNVLATAALDEPAHLATAALALGALIPWSLLRRHWASGVTVLAGAVLLDLDHLPLYLGLASWAGAGRPVTHSLLTPLVCCALAVMLPRRAGRWAAALALGSCLHLVRDLATGPGVSLCWPLTARSLLLPYPWYSAVVVLLGAAATVRLTHALASSR